LHGVSVPRLALRRSAALGDFNAYLAARFPARRKKCTAADNPCGAARTARSYSGRVAPTMFSRRPSFAQPTEAEIQHAAYFLWIESGRQPGHDLDHWFAAKALLLHRHAPGRGPTRRVAFRRPIGELAGSPRSASN